MSHHKRKLALVSLISLVLLLGLGASPASAAYGTNGSIEDNIGNAVDGERLYVHLYNLDVSSDYTINHTGDSTGESFTTAADQTEIYFPVTLAKSATTEAYVIQLWGNTTSPNTVIDQVTVFVSDPEDLTQEDLFMDLAIPIMIMAIFAAIALGFVGRRR
jgi:ABC-type Fe3+-siderophore transport system permease subunit